jgi:protein-disulfide isomerase
MASSTKDTKAVASAARERAAQLKAQERRAQGRNRLLIVLGALAVAVLVGFAVKYIADSGGGQLYDSGKLTAPSVADASGGILLNQDGSAGGTPPADAVRVDVYVDLMCPVCHQFETINGDTLTALRESGTIALYYHPVSILDRYSLGTRYPTRASSAVVTVAEYDPTHFEAFFAALFDNQPKEQSSGLSNATIAQIAKGAGVPDSVIAKFKDGEFTKWVTSATNKASEDGLQGTPWIRVEQSTELDGGIWQNTTNLQVVLQYIHDNGLQMYLDSMAAAQAAQATPSPTP